MNRFLLRNNLAHSFKPFSNSCKSTLHTLHTLHSTAPKFTSIKTPQLNVSPLFKTKRIGLMNAIITSPFSTKHSFHTQLSLLNNSLTKFPSVLSTPAQTQYSKSSKYSGTRAYSTNNIPPPSSSFFKKIWLALRAFGYRWFDIRRTFRIFLVIFAVVILALVFGTILKYILYALLLFFLYRYSRSLYIHWKFSKFFHFCWPYVTKYRDVLKEEIRLEKPRLMITPINKSNTNPPEVCVTFFPWTTREFVMEIVGEPKKGKIDESNINNFFRKADYLYVKSVSVVSVNDIGGPTIVLYSSEDDRFSMDPETKIQTEGMQVLEGEVISDKKSSKKDKKNKKNSQD